MATKKNQQTKLESHEKFMQMAVDLSQYAIDTKTGGPFGAIVVKDGKIIGRGSNSVKINCDPTAHAEVMAIRDACSNLDSLDLSGCELYTSAEPCPMCTAAVYWSKLSKVYYSNTEDDAIQFGFVDKLIMAEIRKPVSERKLPFREFKNSEAVLVFKRATI